MNRCLSMTGGQRRHYFMYKSALLKLLGIKIQEGLQTGVTIHDQGGFMRIEVQEWSEFVERDNDG